MDWGAMPPRVALAAMQQVIESMEPPPPQLVPVASPLVDGLILINEQQLKIEQFKVKVDAYAATTDHFADALRYGLGMYQTGQRASADYPEPPETPPGLTPDQHAAHLMLHELMSVEEFEEERCKPGFVQVTEYWGANGKRKFCCEKKVPMPPGGSGFVDAQFYYNSVELNAAWMAKVETEAAPVRRSAWEKLKGWLKG